MMSEYIKHLISLAFVGSAALFFCPEGGIKRILKILCTVSLAAAILTPLRGMDYDFLSTVEARFSSAEAEVLHNAERSAKSLKELLFSQNCEEYTEEQAQRLGLRVNKVSFTLIERENEELAPFSVTIEAVGEDEAAEKLCRLLRDELGIPIERQEWALNE